jgi:hypothetical protein
MEWEVEFTDEFGAWWEGLGEAEQEDINASVILLQQLGPILSIHTVHRLVVAICAHA